METHSDQSQTNTAVHSIIRTLNASLTIDIKRPTLLRIAWLMVAILLGFAAFNLTVGDILLAKIEIGLGIAGLILLLLDRKHIFSNWVMTSMMVVLTFFFYSYLFLSGGVEGTGVYWIFLFPFLVFFLHGIHLGLLWTVLFFIFNAAALLTLHQLNHPLPYPPHLLERLALVYCAMAGFALLFESLHYKRQYQMRLDHQQFAALVENSTDLICVVDPLGNMLYLSPSFVTMTGFSLQEAVGKSAMQFIHPDDQVKIKQALKNLALKHKRIERQEYRFKAKSGEWLTLEGIGQAIFDEGTITIIINVRNITERNRMEKALQASENKFSTLFHSSHDAIIIHDPDGHIVDCNHTAVRQFGYTSAAMKQLDIRQLRPGSDNTDDDQLMMALKHSDAPHLEVEFRKQDGSAFYGDVVANNIYIDGRVLRQFIIRDTTAQRTMAEQLRQAQKMEAIGTLAGGIAHDFNNTLAAMQGNLYLAQMHAEQPDIVREKLGKIDMLSHHAADMVQQLLTFARKGMVSMRPLALNDIMANMGKISATLIPENISLQTHICAEQLMISADQTQLQQVIMNLLTNARDAVASVAAPAIDCRLEPFDTDAAFRSRHPDVSAERYAHLLITDNGCGIEEQYLEQLFDPFFTTKDVGKGTGLGLSMVYGAVQTHGGMIDIESQPGVGTSIHIYLPLADSATKRAANSTAYAQLEQDRSRITILLVDDNSSVRNTHADVFSALGYQTLLADNGESALALFRQNQRRIDCVITDIVMPKLNGIAAASKMRHINPHVPVIFISGYDTTHTKLPDELMHNSAVLAKPCSVHKLDSLILQLISGSRSSADHRST